MAADTIGFRHSAADHTINIDRKPYLKRCSFDLSELIGAKTSSLKNKHKNIGEGV